MRQGKYETYVEPYLNEITKMAETQTEGEIAQRLGISVSSFKNYKAQHEELKEAIRKGRQSGRTAKIEKYKSLLEKRAEGFHYTETKKVIRSVDGVRTQVVEEYEKYSPPDVGALHLLLKNLDDEWTNDDKKTMDLKKEKLEIERLRTELNNF